MTVCIATMCNSGRNIISATDGLLSQPGGVSGEVIAGKMLWLKDWLFLYAGNDMDAVELVLGEIREAAKKDPKLLSKDSMRTLLRKAHRNALAKWSADKFLSPYDMDMAEFKKEGRKVFGDEHFAELSRAIEQEAWRFYQEILATGWGDSEDSAAIYGLAQGALVSCEFSGIAAIGSGGSTALSTLFSLGCGRNMAIEEAIYAVAAAKFMAESCDGVGKKNTAIFVGHRRTAKDPRDKLAGHFIQPPEIAELRGLWERYSKPTIPKQALPKLDEIARRIGTGSVRGMVRHMSRLTSGKG